jgi:hypothetical protein
MMRIIMATWWVAAIFWLAAHPLEAQPPAQKPVRAPQGWPKTVKGNAQTDEAAKMDAVEHLLKETTLYLEAIGKKPVEWQPTLEFIKKELLEGPGEPGDDEDLGDRPDIPGKAKTWILSVKPLDLSRIALFDEQAQRQVRAEKRLLAGSFVVAGAAVLCVLAVGGISINEWWKKWRLKKKPQAAFRPTETLRNSLR